MSENFDGTLTEALDLVAGSTPPPGAAAARTRGRKRTVRRRITASAMSCVLMAGGTAAAYKATSSHDAAPAQQSAAAGTHPGNGPRDVTRLVPAALLTVKDFPTPYTDGWTILDKTSARAQNWVVLPGEIDAGPSSTCITLNGGVIGEQSRLFGPPDNIAMPGQYYHVYPTAAAAADSYAKAIKGLNACTDVAAGVKIWRTAASADGSAWSRNWSDRFGSEANHFYVLRQGRVLEIVVFSERVAGDKDPQGRMYHGDHDSEFLATLEKKLAILTHS